MNIKNNLLPAKKESADLSINRMELSGTRIELNHQLNLTRRCKGVRSVNVTSDNRYLIITCESNIADIRVADLDKLEFLPHKYEGHTDSVRLTSITRDNKAFFTASWDGSSRRFEIVSGECTQILSGFGRSPSCFIDEDKDYLFTASYDSDLDLGSRNTARCWDLSSGKTINVYKHTKERCGPECIDIAYSEGKVYTGSDDGCAYQWDVDGEKPLLEYFSFFGSIRKVAVSPNYFAAACTDGIVRVHKKFSGELFRYFLHSETDIREVRISKDETKLWSAACDGSVSCFNLITGGLLFHRKIHNLWIWSVCLMKDDKILVTGSGDGSIAFLSADSGQILARLVNTPGEDDFLITCPPDKVFTKGFFYTTNKDLIEVFRDDRNNQTSEKLELKDTEREAYINKLNLKNLVITRLKNSRHYDRLTEQYKKNQNLLIKAGNIKAPLLLKA